jgi:hypothetical protein
VQPLDSTKFLVGWNGQLDIPQVQRYRYRVVLPGMVGREGSTVLKAWQLLSLQVQQSLRSWYGLEILWVGPNVRLRCGNVEEYRETVRVRVRLVPPVTEDDRLLARRVFLL